METLDNCENIILTSLFFFALPQPISKLLIKVSYFKQKMYNKITLILLETSYISDVVLFIHSLLFFFRIVSLTIFAWVDRYINIHVFAIIISMVFSRLHIAGYLILFCLFFIYFDLSVVNMARFYKQHPAVFGRYYPRLQESFLLRGIGQKVGQVVMEATSNPYVQATATAVAGMVVWKALDVYDTQTTKDIAEQDRQAAADQADKDRQAAADQADKDRAAENARAEANRLAENTRASEDRAEENRRTAYQLLHSPEANALSEVQLKSLEHTINTGRLEVPEYHD